MDPEAHPISLDCSNDFAVHSLKLENDIVTTGIAAVARHAGRSNNFQYRLAIFVFNYEFIGEPVWPFDHIAKLDIFRTSNTDCLGSIGTTVTATTTHDAGTEVSSDQHDIVVFGILDFHDEITNGWEPKTHSET